METTTYTVEFSATRNGFRMMGVRHVDLIEGYSTFADIPAIIEAMGYRELVIIKAELKNN